MSFKTSLVSGCGLVVAWCSMTLAAAPAQQAALQPTLQPTPHHCSAAAIEQAPKLLTFHFGPDSRIEIDKTAKALAPIRNPANRAQRLDVLEVWGHIYKGQYRMRFIYMHSAKECVLVGQEILEYAAF
jgi:hypothetical protein